MSRLSALPASQRGAGIVELMLAMLAGLLLVVGMVSAHQQASRILRGAETVSRLQEVARLAFDVIETDLRMANYWGLHSRPDWIANSARPGASLPAAFTPVQDERISACGGPASHWAIHLEEYVGGSNGGYALACSATGGASAGADTLLVRRAADARATSLDPQRIFLQASRTAGALFVPQTGCTSPSNGACLPAGFSPDTSESRQLVVHAYYVSPNSTQRAGLPALRRKSFGNVNAASPSGAISDEELVAGVEDLQVRFGIDTDADASLDQYVDPGAVPPGARVVAVTIWLRVRSEETERGHVDHTGYRYADMVSAWTPDDGYRRIVVSRTIHLRNTRT